MKLADDLAAARAGGRRVVLVMSGAIAAGMPALGLDEPSLRHGDAPGDRGGGPTAPVRANERAARQARRRGGSDLAHAVRFLSPVAISPRPRHAAASPRPRRVAHRQRERHGRGRRDSLRRQRPSRGVGLAHARRRRAVDAHRHRRCVHRGSAPRRRSVVDRGDRRDRRRARRRRRRGRHGAGKWRDGEQVGGRQDRGVVGRARGDRVGRAPGCRHRRARRARGRDVVRARARSASRAASCGSRSHGRRRARSWSTRARGARS